ncbi:16S rRNA processing protein RimM [Anoxybacillus flavithermus TNO-09.006]|uniref:Ribosome maturation factor RimM n=1 Tax=Anoxybacillus flavithermus TaxID=33934 RepID=A0AAX2A6N0_9BACL|nr:ribosome maturation factor RimM [Anoxybacillus flavithermus]ELK21688.1 16S rRNA processing protein RimM [Anoxybacillus flavithermus TNO-09.006]ASA96226.1 ribosome maturation factor RimM [Anoxybacillus flavithermus]MBE2904112.1 ribosome maturation factor RimM [Anoxybacillus flavithermus]MBE2906614.1 ribosome maturation factor RimM [Anoxybacillus flavithermus]MBE2910085.1 ribosome maturation factor RimM [Anoxybacillus flavithermus]
MIVVKWFHVGKIVNTHGIRGEVRVISRTDFAEERYKIGNVLYIFMENKPPVEVKVASHRVHKSFDLLTFEGYDNINLVEPFKGAMIKIPETQLQPLNEGEYYFHEIIGCTVVTEDGEPIGEIKEILTPGANDVWVVKRKKGGDVLIPYIDDVVKQVDVENKTITIHVMEGLLDE